ncbi:MAG TPA: DUF4260 domain-containing protein [Gemmatimonadales bacterium]|nr:DUF4260 domain-containing protein [Gemmatimonadales bacterium]
MSLVGGVTGPVRAWLRLEGLAVLVASVALYAQLDGGWGRFALLFLAPDLSFLGYAAGPRRGAAVYNAAHSYLGPLLLALAGVTGDPGALLPYALIWTAHIGFDRLLGYGLKYPTSFHDTHLGRIGPRAADERRP